MRLLNWIVIGVITLMGCAPSLAATTAFTGATIIDGTGGAPIPGGVVVVTDGKIAAVGASGQIQIPADADVIDVSGKFIIPGLINAHGHVQGADIASQLALYARFGVTTLYSLGDDGVQSVRIRDAQRVDPAAVTAARLYVSGSPLTARTAEDGQALVSRTADQGVDIIKIRAEGAAAVPQAYGAMIEAAHARDLRVAAHMFSRSEAEGLVDAGVDVLAHSIRDGDVSPALIEKIKAAGVGYIPTLTRDLSVFVYESVPAFASDPFFTREPSYQDALARLTEPAAMERMRTSENAQSIKAALAQAYRNLKLLADGGVAIAMGTDTGAAAGRFQGYFEHLELAMMVEAGLSPMQALVAATGDAAKVMEIDDVVGTLQPGRYADLLVLGADPLADIANTKTLEQVWIGGRRVN